MTIAFGAIGAKSAGGTTTTAVAYPASVGAGDFLVIADCGWPNTAGVNTIAGWTYTQLGGGAGTTSVDNHLTTVAAFRKEAAGGETGTVTVTRGGSPTGQVGVMARYTKTAATWETPVQVSGTDNSHGANRSITTGTLDLAPGDMLVIAVAVDTDTALTITSPTLTATGITFGTITRRTSGAGVVDGPDGNVELFDAPVTAGTATVAVTFAFTTATSQCGPVVVTRLREVTGTDGNVAAVPATATADALPPAVDAEQNADVAAATATATAAAVAPVVSAGVDVTVTAVAATATAAAAPPTVAGVRNATVAAVPATASAATPAPAVSATRAATVAAVVALATAACGVPAATGGASVTPPAATATAVVLPPVVSVSSGVTVNAVPATASAAALPPAVSGVRNTSVTAVAATSSAAALPPVATGAATVNALRAQATASALAPTVTGSATVVAVAAAAAAAVVPPVVSSASGATVAAVTATATAAVRPPTVTTSQSATVVAVPATATAAARAPAVTASGEGDGTAVDGGILSITIPEAAATLTVPVPRAALTIPGSVLTITIPTAHIEVTMSGTLHVGDTAPRFTAALTSKASPSAPELPVNLTGATVEVHLEKPDGTVVTLAATHSGAGGVVTGAAWGSVLDQDGDWSAEVEVTYSDSTVQTFGTAGFRVEKALA